MKRQCLILSVFLLLSSALQAQILTKISFNGLQRTKESFLQEELSSYIGRPLTAKTLNNIESDLQAMNLFSSINIKQNPAEAEQETPVELYITVTEKISFIPLPFAMYSSDSGFMAGGFIMDMNAGGRKNIFVTGLIWSPDNTMLMGTYSHQPKIGVPGFSLFASVSNQNIKIKNSDGDTLLRFKLGSANARGNALFRINRYNSANLGLGYSGFFPRDTDDFEDLYVRNRGIALAGWNIADKNWNGVFLSESSFNFDANISFDNKSHVTSELSSSIRMQQPVTKKLRVNVDAGAGIVLNGLITDNLGKSSGRVTILEDKFSTPKIAGLSSGLEYAFLQTGRIGTFSVYGNYEFVFAQEFDDSLLFCHGFNTGMKVYLKELAFPALSVGLAYNATKNKFSFAGSFGVSF